MLASMPFSLRILHDLWDVDGLHSLGVRKKERRPGLL